MPVPQVPGSGGRDPSAAGRGHTSSSPGVTFTDAAASKVAALLAQENRSDLRLRVAVRPGGCSGLRYQLYFDDRLSDGDLVAPTAGAAGRDSGGFEVVIDPASRPRVAGATID